MIISVGYWSIRTYAAGGGCDIAVVSDVQADLVMAGVFLHDIGKTEELSYEMAFHIRIRVS